jgi:hypothetical protein
MINIRLSFCLSLILCVQTVRSDTITWINTSGGNWSNPNNWSPSQVPGPTDQAVISEAGNYSVSLDVNATVAELDLGASVAGTTQTFLTGGQTLTVNGPIQVTANGQFNLNGGGLAGANVLTGALTWSGGLMTGVTTVAAGSTLNIEPGGGDGFYGLILTNYGTVNWSNTTIYGRSSQNTEIYNYGVWNAQTDYGFQGGYEGAKTIFANFGTFLKSGNGGTTTLDPAVVFNNTGIINAQNGTIAINNGMTSDGEMTNSASGSINFSGYVFANTNTIAGNGTFLTGEETFSGSVIGTLNWVNGALFGTLTVPSNSIFNILPGGGDGFYGLILTNYGTVNWSNTTIYGRSSQNSEIYNYGVWNAQTDYGFQGGYEGASTIFANFGTFLKSGNGGTTTLDPAVVFNNNGTINAQNGTIAINNGMTSDGEMTNSASGSINFSGFAFANTNTFAGNGSFLTGEATFSGSVIGTLNWVSGPLFGTLTVPTHSVFNILPGGGDGFYGLVLTNYGTVNWSNTTIYGRSSQNSQIYNYGVWNAQSDNGFQGGYDGGTTFFANFGTFLKSENNGGATTLDAAVNFNNTGTVDVESGTLDMARGTNSDGDFTTADGATINFVQTVFNFINTTTFNGTGTFVGAGAAFSGTIVGTLNWDGGPLSGILTIPNDGVFNIVSGGGDGFYGLILTNNGVVNWTNTTIYGRNGQNAQIYNYGLWDEQGDDTFQGGYDGGTTLFNNFGTVRKTGNLGTTTFDGRVVFNNMSSLEVQSGTVNIGGGTSSGGNFITTGGATLNFYNSAYNFTNSTTFTGVGGYLSSGANFGGPIFGTLAWAGGSLSGGLTIATNGVLNIVAGGGDGLTGLALTNYGTVNWTNTTIYGRYNQNAQIYNYGMFVAQSDNTFEGGYDGGTTLFNNFGTFLKSGNTGVTTLDGNLVFNNSGKVIGASGTLQIQGGGANSRYASYITENGGSLQLNNMTFANGATINSGTAVQLGGNTTVDGALMATNLQLVSGNLGGTNVLVGSLIWSGGSLSGSMTIASNSVLSIVSGGGDGFYGFILTNYGTVNWTNTTIYGRAGQNAQIYNYGLWDAQSDDYFEGGYDGGITLFDNFGTFIKSGNLGTTTLDANVLFNNANLVNAESGTLSLNGGGTNSSSGIFTTAGTGLLSLDNMTFSTGSTIGGSNFVELGGNTTIDGALTATNLELVSGVLGGTNVLQGALTWAGGSLSGDMTIATNGVLNIVAGGGGGFDGLVLTNYGTVNWTNTSIYSVSTNEVQIYNYGLWDAQSDSYFAGSYYYYYGGETIFDNFGTFAKSEGTNTSNIGYGITFNNTGIVDVQSGTLSFSDSPSLAGGTLNFGINSQTNYGVIEINGAANLSGSVTVDFNNGFLPASGSEFQLVKCAGLSGTLSTGSLPFGMSFVYSSTGVSLVWNGITQSDWAAGPSVLHGSLSTEFLESPGMTVELVATMGGVSTVLGSTTNGGLGTISFNAGQLANGLYSLQAVVLDSAGQVVGDYTRPAFVNNSLSWHDGTLTTDQTWGTNAVNAVDQNVIIPSGVTLTLAPGAIVKFAEGTGIIIEAGGVLDASGATTNDPVILTSLKDDSAGGDSNEDGDNSVPEPGDWNGIINSGEFLANAYTEVRYVLQTHSGLISQSQEWSSAQEHFITGNIIVPSGVTLAIAPGAIIKFNLGLNITVQSGGKLVAQGTVAQPIVFTSINDDSVGTEKNGATSTPAAGDWDSIYFSGGTGTFDHVTLSYGGGPDSLNSGLISITGAGGAVDVSDSILNQGLYRGLQAEYGIANVSNCVVTGCDRGIQSGLDGTTVVNVINCTLDNNNYGVFAHGGVMNLANTIISDSLTAGVAYCCGSTLSTFEYCDVWSATGSYASPIWPIPNQTGIQGNISVNPQFINAALGNYELNFNSPCIDSANGAVAPVTDLTGAPRYSDPAVPIKNGVTNVNGVYPDIGAYEFVQTASSPVDLIANFVIGPATETAGQQVTLQWSDINIGTGNATGPWHDTISLVSENGGPTVTVATVLVAQNVVLGPGQSCAATANVVVPGGQAGSYQWQVHVNSLGDVFEGVNWTNNISLDTATSLLEDPSVPIGGVAASNIFTAAGQLSVSTVVAVGEPFVVNVQGSTAGCALKVFVGDGYVPTPSHFDFASSQFNSPTASVTVPSDNEDTYYVVVYAVSLDSSSVTYTLTVSETSFSLNSVSPATMVNTGPVTLQIQGNQLAANDSYTLTGPGGSFAASPVQSADATVAYATFNLGGAASGSYSLQVTTPAGATLTLTNAVQVTSSSPQSPGAVLSLQLELPQAFRADRPFNGAIVYSDAGAVDLPAPILILTSGGVARMALQGSSNYSSSDMVLLGASLQGPAGTLTPGASWTIPFTAVCTNEGSIPFAVNYKSADANDTIDYNALETSLRPAGYSDADWNLIWPSLQSAVGPTWGGFVSFVDSYSTEMALENDPGTFYLVSDVLAFAYAKLLDKATANALGTVYLKDTNHPVSGVSILFTGDNGSNSAGTISASDGTFSIGGLMPGTYNVSASGYWLPTPITVTIPDSDYIAGLSIIVNQGGSISGTLSNAAYGISASPGSPSSIGQEAGPVLSGITVDAYGTGTNSFTTTSDQNGDYFFSGLPPDTYEIVELGENFGGPPSATFAVEYATNLLVSNGSGLVQNFLVSLNEALLEAQVYAADSAIPITNAEVSINLGLNIVQTTNTDSTGAFSLSVNGTSFAVNVSATGYLPFAGTLQASPNPAAPTIIYLTPAASVLFALDASSGGITNGVVTMTSNGVVIGLGATDGNGQVTISNLAAGNYVVQETAYGFQTITSTLTVAAGGSQTISSTLATLGGITGKVSDATGNAISGISVTVYGDGATNQDIVVNVETDGSGNYAVQGLPPGSYGVSVGNGGGVEPQEAQIVSSGQVVVNFTLSGSVVRGVVLGQDGVTPVPLATVALAQSGQILATAQADTNGEYTFRVLLPGTYDLAASAPTGLSSNELITITSGSNLQAGPLVFGPNTLHIFVADENNKPLADASVALFVAKGGPLVPQVFGQTTDASGNSSFSGLISTPYIMVVHQPGFGRFFQTITLAGSSNINCILNPAVTMSGVVTNAAGLPINQATVTLYDPVMDILIASASTDSSGNYSVSDLYLGNYNIVISQTNYATTEMPNVSVNTSPFTQNGVLAGQTTSISGVLTDAAGTPLATGLIEITNMSGVIFAFLPTGGNGSWATTQLPPGDYAIVINTLGYLPPPPQSIHLLAETPVTLSNTLSACATDDDDGGNGDDGFFDNLTIGVGNLFKNLTGSVQPALIPVPGIPAAGDCDDAKNALAACKAALQNKENAYINWEQGYRGTSESLGATGSTALVHSLVFALDALAQFTPVGSSSTYYGLAALPGASKVAAVGSDVSTTIAHISTTLIDLKNNLATVDIHDPTSLGTFLAGTLADGTANGLDVMTLVNLKAGLVGSPGSPYAVAADAVTVLLDLYTGIQDYQAALGTDQANQFGYQVATQSYLRAIANLQNANANCPPPKPTDTPPPNDTQGPTQQINSVQSGDPNDKTAAGVGQSGWVPEGTAITYTIDFENESTASAPAQIVTITDPLSPSLDGSTLQLTAIAFNNVIINIPPGVQTFSTNVNVSTDPNPVSVSAALNPATGTLTWEMESINAATGQLVTDPLAGFLPPDNKQGQGEGYVTYTIQPTNGLATGFQITNQATIVFDANSAIATPVATNFVGSGPPAITGQPQDVITNIGGTVVFGIELATNAPYLYQWSKNGTILPGATHAELTLANVQVGDAGQYSVSVSTGVASTNSAPAALTVTTNSSVNEIEIVITGGGKVSPYKSGKILQVGHVYTLTAAPDAGYLFAGWTGNASTNTSSLKFVMQSNMLLQASFVTNIFLKANGTYEGLFAPIATARQQTNSGSFVLRVATTGALSGDLYIGSRTVPLTGKFDVTGAATVISVDRGENTLTTTLQLDLINNSITGAVSDGSFVASLAGNQNVFSASQKASAFEGQYTVIIPGASEAATGPFGVSYGTLKVSSLGVLTLAGSLADGTAISQSSVVSKDGYWPLYISLYAGKGSLWCWNHFTNHTIVNAGPMSWINETNSSKTAVYRSGFTNQAATLIGGIYLPTVALHSDLPATLEGGNLPFTISLTTLAGNADKLTLKTNAATGVVSGTFINPAQRKETIKVNCVILQGQTNAQGYFLGTNQSGSFILGNP